MNEIKLGDTSRLVWSEYGATDGEPVFYFNSVPSSHLEAQSADKIALDLGIRLIVTDRSGYGDSDLKNTSFLLDWPDIVSQLADKLGLKIFSLLGFSAGGMYALACAHAIPDRIKHVTLVSSVAPFETEAMQKHINAGFKPLYELSAADVHAARQQVSQLIASPEAFLNVLISTLPESDKAVFNQNHIKKHYLENVSHSIKNGVSGIVNDCRNIASPWQFTLNDIEVPIDIWHGRDDTAVGFAIGEYLTNTLKNATPHFLDNCGHYFIYDHWQEILKCSITNKAIQYETVL